MADFSRFSALIHARFVQLSQHELFVTVDGDHVWSRYLAAFPEGTNEIYRERTEHDCSCCKNFIRNLGNVVAIVDGQLQSIWAVEGAEYPYNEVAAELDRYVTSAPITSLFRATEGAYGAEYTFEHVAASQPRKWHHFHGKVAAKHYTKHAAQAKGDYATTVQVFKRGLEELTPEAFETAISLIEAKTLYRGEEFLAALQGFQVLLNTYRNRVSDQERDLFVWAYATNPATRFRNTAMGTLIQDLSAGMELEAAVRSFEAKVAPTNYKRPTALVTPRMVQDALKTIRELGLESALERRFAKLSDVSVNNVLWVDNSVRAEMKDGLEGLLMAAATRPVQAKPDQAEAITMDAFMASVLPQATSLEVFVKNAQQANLMSLTAPVHAEVEPLFKWGNNFGWSYNGNITDSIKERVKKAGGAVEGDLCCRLAWDYADDLDFYMREPNGHTIHFGNRRQLSPNGGMLDVDANGIDGPRPDPAENIFYADRTRMREGVYVLSVNNYSRRSDGVGFEVEIEFGGQTHRIAYDKVLQRQSTVTVAKFQVTRSGIELIESLPASTASKSAWGIQTEQFIKVNTLMFSPNHWDGNAVGNKHWFFVLDGCRNDEPARGIYNEFLKPELEKHRKVFELVGAQTKCPVTDEQLSGVGFSSTRNDSVLVRVTGSKLNKLYHITF